MVATVATSNSTIAYFFNYVPLIVNTVSASCMRNIVLLAKHQDVLLKNIEKGEISTAKGLNQKSSLARAGDTRRSSHHIYQMWEAIIEVLEIVRIDFVISTCNGGAFDLIGKMETFNFVFIMHLMIDLLSITDNLSCALQRKDQDIIKAMSLIIDVKDRIQDMRDDGCDPLF